MVIKDSSLKRAVKVHTGFVAIEFGELVVVDQHLPCGQSSARTRPLSPRSAPSSAEDQPFGCDDVLQLVEPMA